MPKLVRGGLVLAALGLLVSASACASSTEDSSSSSDDGAVSTTDQNVVVGTDHACNLLALYSSGNPEVKRALDWVGRKVPYSKSVTRPSAPYRADCSGLVSEAWQLPPAAGGPDTAHLAPYFGAYSTELGSWEELRAGDALNFHKGNDGHVMLFLGWVDASHKDFCVIEEYGTGKPAATVRHSTTDPASHWGGGPGAGTMLKTYNPIRKLGD